MSPSKREREYQRRRYEEYQKRQAERAAVKARRKKQSRAAALAAVALVLVVGVVWFFAFRGNESAPSAASTKPAAPTASGSAGACPRSAINAVSNPKQWKGPPAAATAKGHTYTVTLATTCGDVVLSLDGSKAPQAVASTVFLAKNGFYNNTPCHRLTTSGIYVLQCGDPTGTGTGGPGYHYGPVENAPKDNVYPAGTVAMARSRDNAKSNGSQFFLVYEQSTIPSDKAGGYTVIGKITKGLDVVQKVAAGGTSDTTGNGGAPNTPVGIKTVTVTG